MGKQPHSMPARVLLCLLFPGHILFIFTVKGPAIPSVFFFLAYLTAAVLQVAVLLYLCHLIVYFMWLRGTDPDNAAIPYLTAVGDLLGTSLLAAALYTLIILGDESLDQLHLPDHHNHTMESNITSLMMANTTHSLHP